MINYENPYITTIEAISNFEAIGVPTLQKMGVNPFMEFIYKSKTLDKYNKDVCKETEGDCFKWINRYLKIQFIEI